MEPVEQTPMTPPGAPQPEMQSQPLPQTPVLPTVKSGKKMTRNMLVGVVVAVIVVAALAVYGVYAYVNNMPNNVLQSAVNNLTNMKSFSGKFTFVAGTNPSTTFTGDLAATMDQSNGKNGEAIIGFGTGKDRTTLNALSLDGSLYLKAANLEGLNSLTLPASGNGSLLNTPELASAFKNIDNQWFEFSSSDIQSLSQTSGSNNISGAVSPDDIKHVAQLYNQHPFIQVDKTYNDEVVDGTNAAHFSLKVDKTTEISFLQAVKTANLATIKVTDQDITDAKNTDATKDTTLEVWVARDSRTFKQFRLVSTKQGDASSMTVTMTSALPTFDAFTKPAGAKPFSQILTLLLGSSNLSQYPTSSLPY